MGNNHTAATEWRGELLLLSPWGTPEAMQDQEGERNLGTKVNASPAYTPVIPAREAEAEGF
jgi:hypothetical protein